MRPGPRGPGGAADATAVDDGLRAGAARVPGRRRRRRGRADGRRRSRGLRGRGDPGAGRGGRHRRLDRDALVPLSRWVTPPGSPRRYDTRFFVAWLPDGAEVVRRPARGRRPSLADAARRARRDGRRARSTSGRRRAPRSSSWRPRATSRTSGATSRPSRPPAPPVVERLSPAVVRVTFGGAGAHPRPDGRRLPRRAVARRRRRSRRPVGRGGGRDRRRRRATSARRLAAILLTAPVPDHAAGAETLALRLDVPILASAGASAVLSSEIVAIEDGDVLGVRRRRDPRPRDAGDASRPPGVRAAGGGRGAGRATSYGPGPSRAIPEPVDEAALSRSRGLVEGLGDRRLAAHR